MNLITLNKNLKQLVLTLTISSIFMTVGSCQEPVKNRVAVTKTDTVFVTKMLRTQGIHIVNEKNQQVKLRGVLLEGWLMWNGTLYGAGLTSETKILKRLEQMAGKDQTDAFQIAIYDNFITEKDIEMIAEVGFNTVRIPFNHTILEDDNPLENYSAIGWKYIDNLLTWCEKYNIYVVLDFHSVPGGQGAFVSDPDLINVWFSNEKQERTVEIWQAIAKRYANKEIIAGYDLINEPDPPKGKDLVELHKRIIKAIREVDKNHIIFIEGGQFASSDFSMYDEPLDDNLVYSFHSYNLFGNETDQSNLKTYADMAKNLNVPFWNGEFGAHNAKWIKEELAIFENPEYQINGWTFWPWKRVSQKSDRYRHLGEIRTDKNWDKVATSIASFFGPDKKITQEMAKEAMDNFVESTNAENLVFDKEIKKILTKYLK